MYFDSCTGSRASDGLVDEEGDPLLAIARRYLGRSPCARMENSTERFDRLFRIIEESDIRGVIYYVIKFCDPFIYNHILFNKRAKEKGVPVLCLESEYDAKLSGQMKTRLDAFLEMIG